MQMAIRNRGNIKKMVMQKPFPYLKLQFDNFSSFGFFSTLFFYSTMASRIEYSEKYFDDKNEYRYAALKHTKKRARAKPGLAPDAHPSDRSTKPNTRTSRAARLLALPPTHGPVTPPPPPMILSVLTRHRCFPIPHMPRAPSPRPQLNRAQARDPPARDRKEHPQGAAPVGDPVAQPRRAAEPWVGSLRRAPVRNAQRVGGRCETADEGVCVCV